MLESFVLPEIEFHAGRPPRAAPTVRSSFPLHVLVTANIFNLDEPKPLIKSMRIFIEHEHHVPERLLRLLSFVDQLPE
jgi:hypothetical protein